jgi:sugar transferase (PEP-CTERM system associated)
LIRVLNSYVPERTLLLVISEACLVSLTFVASAFARLGLGNGSMMLNQQAGILTIALSSIGFVMCMYYFDLYDSAVLSNWREVLVRLLQVLGTAYVVLAVISYAYSPLRFGEGTFQIGILFVAVLLVLWRKLFAIINNSAELAERVLIFGEGALAQSLVREIESRPELGIRIASHAGFSGGGDGRENREQSGTPTMLSSIEACEELAMSRRVRGINRIVVAMDERRGKLPVELLLSLKNRGIQVQEGNDVYEAMTGKIPIESIRLGWLLFSPGYFASRFFLIYKRAASVTVSIFGLLLSLPLIPFIVLVIKLTSPGPVLYQQRRVGRGGEVFLCYKIRTMQADAEADTGPTWALDDDPRITKVGKFMRQMRIDEIPQLWNVLKGDMSLVGPRPERPEFVEGLSREIPYYYLRHSTRPGITGWAQIRYRYGNTVEDAKEKLRYDLFYIKNMSAGLDLLIFLDTIKIILLGRGAK